jgi:PleD family two-component response regulator
VARAKRRCDVAGQYGLRGFLLLMVQTPHEGGAACCRRLRETLEEQAARDARRSLRVWFGLASYTPEAGTPQALLRLAEQNLEGARCEVGDPVAAR